MELQKSKFPNKLSEKSRIWGVFIFLILALYPLKSEAQETLPAYDIFSVEMAIPELGIFSIPIAIKDQEAYIPVATLFDILKLKNEKKETGLSGFIINPDSTFTINPQQSKITFANKEYDLPNSAFIQTPTTLFIKSDLFGKIFRININFSFRSLSLNLDSQLEFPIIKEKKLQEQREKISGFGKLSSADTIIKRKFTFFKAGVLDWSIVTTQQSNFENNNRLSLGFGTFLLGGETSVRLNYSTRRPFTSKNQFYQWRYVNNDNKVIKQLTAGRIFTNTTSTLFAPVVGIEFSNSALSMRKSFGTYTIHDSTEPHWTVELYVNNVLMDFTEADASGFFTFEVPLMYGTTRVNLRYYGPFGQERMEERLIHIPFSFVQKNKFEYNFSAGIVEDEFKTKISRLDLFYGLSNRITLGGGMEFLSGEIGEEFMPFINSSMSLPFGILFSGEYTFGVRGEGILTYRSAKNFQVEFNYKKYHEDQEVINFNYLEERKISISTPLRFNRFSLFSRLSVNQIILPTTKFSTAQVLLSGSIFGVNTNFSTYGIFNDRSTIPTVYSTLSQTYRLPYRFFFSPQVQFDFIDQTINNLVLEFRRPVFRRGFVEFSYENNFLRNAHIFEVGLRYSFNFAQAGISGRLGNKMSSFVQSAYGSLRFDSNTGTILPSERSSLSKGGLTIIPFLDYNTNGKRDPMEPSVAGLELKTTMGTVKYNKEKTVLHVSDLQPYNKIIVEIDPISLDNIAWKIMYPKIQIETLPNHFRLIHVPVHVLGEVAGMVYLNKNKSSDGLGGIIINIKNEKGEIVKKILSEGDGYFSYLGLKPGKYTAEIDAGQLKDLNFSVSPAKIDFEVEVDKYGDIVDTLEFTLQEEPSEDEKQEGQQEDTSAGE